MRPNIGIGSHRCRSIGHRFFPIALNVGPDIIGNKWNGIGNGSQFFIGPINIGHQKYLVAQITGHIKAKANAWMTVFWSVNTLKFQFKCCRPADKVFLLIINLIFLINVSCFNRNLTSKFRTFVCISYDRVWPEKIKFVYRNGHREETASHSTTLKSIFWVKDSTMYIASVRSKNDD